MSQQQLSARRSDVRIVLSTSEAVSAGRGASVSPLAQRVVPRLVQQDW